MSRIATRRRPAAIGRLGGDRGGVQIAIAAHIVGAGMMAGRPAQGEGGALPRQHRVERGERASAPTSKRTPTSPRRPECRRPCCSGRGARRSGRGGAGAAAPPARHSRRHRRAARRRASRRWRASGSRDSPADGLEAKAPRPGRAAPRWRRSRRASSAAARDARRRARSRHCGAPAPVRGAAGGRPRSSASGGAGFEDHSPASKPARPPLPHPFTAHPE